jgi:uncharacterized protein (TIGR02117 family)
MAKSSGRDRSIALRALAALLTTPLLYILAALAGALIPRNAGWEEPTGGVQIFVRTNGVHADVVLPAQAEGIDWYEIVPPEHVRDPGAAGGWIGVGWGQREFYLETERWADLTVRNAVRALTGGNTLMHVGHLLQPHPSAIYRPLRVSPDAYRRMAEAIARSFERGVEGNVVPLIGEGYGDHDTFYEARGTYHALRTSNQWTSDVLAYAGVTIGVWTPFEQGIMWRFRAGADEHDRLQTRGPPERRFERTSSEHPKGQPAGRASGLEITLPQPAGVIAQLLVPRLGWTSSLYSLSDKRKVFVRGGPP